jgi:hypothetical protein
MLEVRNFVGVPDLPSERGRGFITSVEYLRIGGCCGVSCHEAEFTTDDGAVPGV